MKGTRDHITVNACVLANHLVLLLHIIFAGAFPSGAYAREGPDEALYSISGNGYMDSTEWNKLDGINQLIVAKQTLQSCLRSPGNQCQLP